MATNQSELIADLKVIASEGPIRSTFPGPSGIAATLKICLDMDSTVQSRKHGYKISTVRIGQSTRMTMFAKVPDWEKSSIASTTEMLEAFGYGQGLDKRLNCTLEFNKPNGQGLYLDFSEDHQHLLSKTSKGGELVCTWPVDDLKQKLSEKYEASAHIEYLQSEIAGKTYFELVGVRFYGSPSVSNFEKLVRRGAITLDHVIGLDNSGNAHEKGPLFKISRLDFLSLFPSTEYVKLR